MKIAQLHPYPPIIKDQAPILPGKATQGGGETSSYDFARNLALRGHQVTYYAVKYPGITVNELILTKNFRVKYFPSLFGNLGLAGSLALLFDLIHENYDVIQTHQIPMMYSIVGGTAAKLTKAKFLMTFHGRVAFFIVDRSIGKIASVLADYVTVQNEFGYQKIKSMVPRNKIKFIPHGVSTDIFKKKLSLQKYKKTVAPKKEKVILYVGRLISAKGLSYLISALPAVNKVIKTKLILVGTGASEADLKQQIASLNMTDKVIFAGQVNQADTIKYYNVADVYVLPAVDRDDQGKVMEMVSENFGNALLEAMSCEVPVISADVGGVPAWIKDGVNGYIFPQKDTKALTKKIIKVLQNPQATKKVIKKASALIETQYSWQTVCQEFEKLYST